MIVVDTHILLWHFGGEARKLSANARGALEADLKDGTIFISSITAWEIAVLVANGRIGLSTDVLSWLEMIGTQDSIRFVPIDNEIAVRSTWLGDQFHKDPADRYIVATSQKLGAPLVTADRKIRDYPHVRTIW